MNTSSMIPHIDALKQEAKSLRAEQAHDGTAISHSKSLELVAHHHGYRDWNTVRAASENQSSPASLAICPVAAGDRTSGLYLGQPFAATVLNMSPLESGDLFRITMHFDEPVDVVTHDSFSSLRQRVSGNIDRFGKSREKTSNGLHQIELHVGEVE
jgi:hypothetical protein